MWSLIQFFLTEVEVEVEVELEVSAAVDGETSAVVPFWRPNQT